MSISRFALASALLTSGGVLFETSAKAQVAADPGSAEVAAMGDIIVTAQRRDERLRDVPLSISAMTGQQLRDAGINNIQGLTAATPGLLMDAVGSVTIPSIRGITTQVTNAGSDLNVAFYFDGVYVFSPNTGMLDLPDVERIEVLKGPQGTLFGRNATGGAIRVITREPGNDVAGSLSASYGNLNSVGIKGFVSVPVIQDRAALSVAGSYEHNDGYLRSIQNGDYVSPFRSRTFRGKLRLDPIDNVKIILFADWWARDDTATGFAVPLNGNTVGRTIPGTILLPGDPYIVAQNPIMPITNTNDHYGYGGTVSIDAGIGEIKSISAFGEYKLHAVNDADNSVQPDGTYGLLYDSYSTDRAFSQEVSFSSKLPGKFNFVLGAYYINGWGGFTPLNVLDTFSVSIISKQSYNAKALFGEVYYDVTDRLHLIGGLRYSHERRSLGSGLFIYGTDSALGTLSPDVAARSWNSFTPRASIRYDLTPKSNVYFTFTKGFKGGIFQSSAFALNPDGTLPLADPETVYSYEAGFKGTIANILDLNIALYHYDYKNLQINNFVCVPTSPAPDAPCTNTSVIQNAAAAKINGADIDATLRLGTMFAVRAGISLLDAKYTDFKNAPVNDPTRSGYDPIAHTNTGTVLNTGNVPLIRDLSGYRMIRAPKFTLNVSPALTVPVGDDQLRLNATVYHTSPISYTFDGRIQQKQYTTLDARASYTFEKSGITLAVYGNNLTNTLRIASVFATSAGDAVSYMRPRTYGAEASIRF
jgi:Outer membrane receptor proteins, mostly Fe transport